MKMSATPANPQFVDEPGAPTPAKFSHVSMASNHYAEMIEFYRTLYNMRIVYEINGRIRFCMMSFDEENHRIGIADLPHLLPHENGRAGLVHTSFAYGSMDELFAAVTRFHEKTGRWPASAVHQGPIIAVSYIDPDGNRAELTADVYATQAEIVQYFHDNFHDPEFDTLLSFDVAKMIALRDAGMVVEELVPYDAVMRLRTEGRL
jgi:catechol 2,3-dioxygenase-like lactoylglutathione lyase family enzyme